MWHKSTNSWKKLGYFTGFVYCMAVDNTGAVYATGTIEKGQPGSYISKWDGNTSVSYTHLDVYKRQEKNELHENGSSEDEDDD